MTAGPVVVVSPTKVTKVGVVAGEDKFTGKTISGAGVVLVVLVVVVVVSLVVEVVSVVTSLLVVVVVVVVVVVDVDCEVDVEATVLVVSVMPVSCCLLFP